MSHLRGSTDSAFLEWMAELLFLDYLERNELDDVDTEDDDVLPDEHKRRASLEVRSGARRPASRVSVAASVARCGVLTRSCGGWCRPLRNKRTKTGCGSCLGSSTPTAAAQSRSWSSPAVRVSVAPRAVLLRPIDAPNARSQASATALIAG